MNMYNYIALEFKGDHSELTRRQDNDDIYSVGTSANFWKSIPDYNWTANRPSYSKIGVYKSKPSSVSTHKVPEYMW